MPTTAVHVALALEVFLADFALIRLILLNLGGLAAPCLARRGLERGLGGPFRRLDERKLVVAGNSALSNFATFSTFATCATTSNCANKVALRLVLVLVGAGQDVLVMHHGNIGEHSPERLDGE